MNSYSNEVDKLNLGNLISIGQKQSGILFDKQECEKATMVSQKKVCRVSFRQLTAVFIFYKTYARSMWTKEEIFYENGRWIKNNRGNAHIQE